MVNSITLYGNTLESPALCLLNIEETFTWGKNLVDSQFKSVYNPIFTVDIQMDGNEAYYSVDPDQFGVGLIK